MGRSLLLITLGLCVAAPAGAASTQRVHARLVPVAPARLATGTFSANGAGARTVVLSWRLSVSKLSGPASKATLKTPGSSAIVFTLCRPCSAQAHGKIVLLGSVWRRIAAGGGTVLVTTKAHPRGELRGALKRG
jgi:hypothetical protein